MDLHFTGAPTIAEPLEFGFSVLPLYTTMRDGGLALAAGLVGGLTCAAIGGAWAGLIAACTAVALALMSTQLLRRRYGYHYLTELCLAWGWSRDQAGFLGDTRHRRIFTHAWVPGSPSCLGGGSAAGGTCSGQRGGRLPDAASFLPAQPQDWRIQRRASAALWRRYDP